MRVTVRKLFLLVSIFFNFLGILYFLRYNQSQGKSKFDIALSKRTWVDSQAHHSAGGLEKAKKNGGVIEEDGRARTIVKTNSLIQEVTTIATARTSPKESGSDLEITPVKSEVLKTTTSGAEKTEPKERESKETLTEEIESKTPEITAPGAEKAEQKETDSEESLVEETESKTSERTAPDSEKTEPAEKESKQTVAEETGSSTPERTVSGAETREQKEKESEETLAEETESKTPERTASGAEKTEPKERESEETITIPTETPVRKSTQQCNIPRLDPYHEEALPWAGHRKSPNCNTTTFSTISDGSLRLKLDNVQSAGLYYIRRYADMWTKLSKYHVLVDSTMYNRDGKPACIEKEKGGRQLLLNGDLKTNETYAIVSPATDRKCSEENMFLLKDQNIIHVPTGKCLIPQLIEHQRKSYKVVTEKKSWDEAESNCVSLGGHLVTINSPSLNLQLRNQLKELNVGRGAWIGYSDILEEGIWRWRQGNEDKCNTGYTLWHDGEPNGKKRENCGMMFNNLKGSWNDDVCYGKYASICEFGSKSDETCEWPLIKLSNTVAECTTSYAKFEVMKGGNRFKHVDTSACIMESEKNGYLQLGLCKDNSTIFHIPPEIHPSADVDIRFQLTEELIKVELVHKLRSYTEYHITILKTEEEEQEEREGKTIDQSEMNILLITYDSSSRANIQRQWTKSYEFFKNDQDSIIMKGHVINGDATTANMTPLFTGYAVKDLPEARRHKPGTGKVNRWPLIFKDLRQNHYKTAYIEDQPTIATFYYRLSGFDEQPTDKYVSHWFTENRYKKHNAPDCSNKYIIGYIKDFLRSYSAVKKFAWGFVSLLSHDDLDLMHLTDQDMVDFFQFMDESGFRENTTVLTFGDHGFRNGPYRRTMQGKLEERLPFLAFSMPSWFKEKHPEKWANLQKNSEVLTSWFDVHQTLRHLIHLNNYTNNRPIGKSLFTDVVRLNRSCEDCGIPNHYCPCLLSTKVPNDDPIAVSVGEFVVSYMNSLIENVTVPAQLCNKIVLDAVLRAETAATNKDVQTFSWAYENKDCDRCGIVKDKNFKIKIVNYELQFRVKNFGGTYEASVDYGGTKNKFKLNGDISRLDRYGDQPKCIQKEYATLRKYCYCKDYKVVS